MKIAVPKERREGEHRVAASPDSVKKYVALGSEVAVEAGAGLRAGVTDEAFAAAGASVAATAADALGDADIVLKVQAPIGAAEDGPDELAPLKPGCLLIGLLAPHEQPSLLDAYAAAGVTAFAMELMPRITRAQTMDALSSQSNLAGYKAVIEAAAEFGRAFPMMMTAAGTIAPARCVVLGAGVAGLQAIATARRLGAIVSAFDVRAAAKEQVESLGASFVEVEGGGDAATEGVYAKEMGEDYRRRQAEMLGAHLGRQDIAICTALIPGRAAPVLITEDMVRGMRPGSVIVDLAVGSGGNCALSELGRTVRPHGVAIVGYANMPSRIAIDSSALYAKNLLNFLALLIDAETGELRIDWSDEIVQGTLLTRDGKIVHPNFAAAPAAAAEPRAESA